MYLLIPYIVLSTEWLIHRFVSVDLTSSK